jgi:hypothetical protein
MLTDHEPSIPNIDYASLSPEERAAVVQAAIRRAHAARADAIHDMARHLFTLATFRRADRGNSAQDVPPNCARHA